MWTVMVFTWNSYFNVKSRIIPCDEKYITSKQIILAIVVVLDIIYGSYMTTLRQHNFDTSYSVVDDVGPYMFVLISVNYCIDYCMFGMYMRVY